MRRFWGLLRLLLWEDNQAQWAREGIEKIEQHLRLRAEWEQREREDGKEPTL